MDESDHWPHEPDLPVSAHIFFAAERGEPERRNGWIIVGTITVLRVGMTVEPRRHTSLAERQQLVLAAIWAYIHGPQGDQWNTSDGHTFATQVRVPEPSG